MHRRVERLGREKIQQYRAGTQFLERITTNSDITEESMARGQSFRSLSTGSDISLETTSEGSPLFDSDVAPLASAHASSALSSVPRTFLNTVKAFIASGILGLPYSFSLAGTWAAIGSIPPIAWLSYYCMMQLIDCRNLAVQTGKAKNESSVQTLTDLMTLLFGRIGTILSNACILSSQLGFCVVYIIFVAENMHRLVPSVAVIFWILAAIPVCYGLSLLRSMRVLAPFSGLSNVFLIFGIAVVMGYAIPEIRHNQGHKHVVAASGDNYPVFLSGLIYAFEGIGCVLPVESSMRNRKHFGKVLGVTVIVLVALFSAFGAVGYAAWGSKVESVVTLELPSNGLTDTVLVCLMLSMFGTYGLMMFPAVEIVEKALFVVPVPPPGHHDPSRMKRNLTRLGLVLLTAGLALAIPNFGLVISFIGAFTCVPLMFIFPPAMHYVLTKETASKRAKTIDLSLLVFGLLMLIFASVFTVKAAITGT